MTETATRFSSACAEMSFAVDSIPSFHSSLIRAPSGPTARPIFWLSTAEQDRQSRTRNRCNGEGYESVALVPLICGSERLGLIQLNDSRKDRFTPEKIALFERLAGNISIALKQRSDAAAIRANEENLSSFFNAIDESLCLLDREGTVLAANETFAARLGKRVEECLGTLAAELIPDELGFRRRRFLEQVQETGRPQVFADQRGGRWFVHHVWPVLDSDGTVARVAVYANDITERKHAEELLLDSERRYRDLFEKNPAVKLLIDPESGAIVEANTASCEFYGYNMDEITRLKIFDLNLYSEPDTRSAMKRARRREQTVFEFQHVLANGQVRDVQVFCGPVRVGEQQLLYSIVTDITVRKEAEAERNRLMAAIEQADETIIITDSAGVIQYVNPSFERVTGFSRAEVIGRNPRILKSDRQSPEFYQQLWSTITAGETWRGRMVNRRKDGALYTEYAVISPLFDAVKRITGFVAAMRDITQELRMEQQYHHAQKLESIGRLSGGVAHDLNNLLSPILGYGEMILEDSADSDPIREPVEEIVEAARRARDLVGQLLAFSRKQRLEFSPVNLNTLVRDFERLLRRMIPEDVSIEIVLGQDLPSILGDSGHLEQVVMNLAVNAQDAMPEGGRLTIRTKRVRLDETAALDLEEVNSEPYVLLEVSDTGHGMDAATCEQVFEPFFTSKGLAGGTGLGLSTVYGIVKQHGGRVAIESEVGKGTTCRIFLPAVEDADQEGQSDSTKTDIAALEGSETILLVEDNPAVRNLAQTILKRRGYSVLVASNGHEAIQILHSHEGPVQLLLTDVVMPGMNGRELYERISAIHPEIQVLFISGYTADVMALRGVENSAHFLQKPFSVSALIAKIREVLD